MFKKGNEHELIKSIQKGLTKLKIDCGEIDGIYGKKVSGGVKEFIRTHMVNGDVITYDIFSQILKLASEIEEENGGEVSNEGFSLKLLDEISASDCEIGYAWENGGTSSKYWKRYCLPWVQNTKSYSRRYYPACAMGVHLWLKLSGLKLPYFYKRTSLALVSGFKNWGVDKGLYQVDKWESTIPAFSLLIFKDSSHIGINHKVCLPNEKIVHTREVNRKRKVVEGTRKRTSIQGFIPLGSLEMIKN